ncbi:transcriptional repressor NemR [[Pantoea] beijingensis]|uniref:Transcriptional repressor NemR n=1 Tax=[Pantoea] beijingensis TaxID=1324864 RepID=A0A443IHJ7_9GAMM|nr:TetR/AcrR family transcriptional regulator [[Pantoea] beijingensis]RWR03537.1 transcriptional repressor NemR [[Pantoea] beijingensis]
MNKTTRHDTCEHLLLTAEQLCLQRGFNGMGLSELLGVAGVPKGSFYHYYRSKEAFGVAMLEHYFAHYLQSIRAFLEEDMANPRQRIITYYQRAHDSFGENNCADACLSAKLSAEVCDLSESMRVALDKGSRAIIAVLSVTLHRAVKEQQVPLFSSPENCAEMLYILWLGASLQAKIRRDNTPLKQAITVIQQMLPDV